MHDQPLLRLLIPYNRPMTGNSGSASETSVVALAEGMTKVTVAAAALCYVIGFVTVNVYLGTFGASTNTLVSTEYVLAGVTWALLIALASVPPIILRRLNRIHTTARLRIGLLAGAVLLLFGFQSWILFIALNFLTGNILTAADELTWFAVGTLLATPLLIAIVAQPLWADQQRLSPTLAAKHLFTTTLTMLLATATIAAYAITVYPLILPAYGGARPRVVRITFEKGSVAKEAAAAVFDHKSGTCLLIADSGGWLVLARGDATPLSAPQLRVVACVKRDAVVVILPLRYK